MKNTEKPEYDFKNTCRRIFTSYPFNIIFALILYFCSIFPHESLSMRLTPIFVIFILIAVIFIVSWFRNRSDQKDIIKNILILKSIFKESIIYKILILWTPILTLLIFIFIYSFSSDSIKSKNDDKNQLPLKSIPEGDIMKKIKGYQQLKPISDAEIIPTFREFSEYHKARKKVTITNAERLINLIEKYFELLLYFQKIGYDKEVINIKGTLYKLSIDGHDKDGNRKKIRINEVSWTFLIGLHRPVNNVKSRKF